VKLARLRGPLVLVVLCAAPLVLWARSAPLDARLDGSFTTMTSLAVLCALAGTSAFALNLLLGARLRFVEAARVRAVVTDGIGAMPSFEGEPTGREIEDVAAFVSESAGR
jgi:hypothetical protein